MVLIMPIFLFAHFQAKTFPAVQTFSLPLFSQHLSPQRPSLTMGQTSSSTISSTTPSLPSDSSSLSLSSVTSSEYARYSHVTSSAPSASLSAQQTTSNAPQLTTLQAEGDVPPPSDGYRWRKYGQKSVKGSAYARNYYKCTYPGCTVKKQVDKINNNGKIVDQVLCKGEHCHGPPQITRINAHDQQTFRNSVINESLAVCS